MFHVKHPEAATDLCGGDLRGDGAFARSRNVVPNGKSISIWNLELSFAAQESGTLAKRLVVGKPCPTSRMVQPYEAGTPSEFDAFCHSSRRIPYREGES